MGFGDDSSRGKIIFFAKIGGFALCVFFFFLSCILLGATHNFSTNRYCANGEILTSGGQMWCTPSETTTITASTSKDLSVYRINKSSSPSMTSRFIHTVKQLQISRGDTDHYSFILNPDSSVTAGLTSEGDTVYCSMLNYTNMQKFEDGDPYEVLFSAKGSLDVNHFTPEFSDCFSFVFEYNISSEIKKPDIIYDLNFTYKVYDVSGLSPVCKGSCTLEDVTSDEVVFIDNPELKDYDATLRLPSDVNSGALAFVIILLIASIAGLIVYGVFFFLRSSFGERFRGESKPLV